MNHYSTFSSACAYSTEIIVWQKLVNSLGGSIVLGLSKLQTTLNVSFGTCFGSEKWGNDTVDPSTWELVCPISKNTKFEMAD